MPVVDFLKEVGEDIGKGAATAGRVSGTILEPLGKRVAEVASGEAPEIDAEKRQHDQQLGDQALAAKVQDLESQLETGRKYGTLTPEQQQEYVDAITKLYSHPSQMKTLVEKLHAAVHPGGAAYQPTALPNATPEGGTAARDEAARQKALVDALGLRQAATDEEIDRRAADAAKKPAAGKSPPVTGDQLPPDAAGVNGQPIGPELRNAGKSFVEYQGKWWQVAAPKPVMKTIKGHVVLLDPKSGAALRDLGPVEGAKVTSRQTLQPGDDGQMHLVTLTSVTTPEGATIDVDAGGGTNEPSGETRAAPDGTPKTPARKVGSILSPKTGAKPVPTQNGPMVPGLSTLARSKFAPYKADAAALATLEKQYESDKTAADSYAKAYAVPGNKSAFDTALVTDYTSILAKGGRKTQAEIAFAQKIGGLGLRTEAMMQKAATGELPDPIRQMYLQFLNQRVTEEAAEVKRLKGQLGGTNGQPSSQVIVVGPEDMR